MRNFLLII